VVEGDDAVQIHTGRLLQPEHSESVVPA
jgi:hypothetical protein